MVHEQKHFDIAEMFAMKLRKQLRQIVVKDGVDAKFKLDSLYKIISLEMDLTRILMTNGNRSQF